MYTLQSVLKCFENINTQVRTYVLCLMLVRERKNCAAMARTTGFSPKRLYAFLAGAEANIKAIENALCELARETRIEGVPRTLIIDPTTIIKQFAKAMENLCHDKAGSTKRVERCLVPAYVVLSDENITIPMTLDFWVQEKIIGKKKYRSKVAIAKELISLIISKKIAFDFLSLDGAFSVEEMFDFCRNYNTTFVMRIAKSRIIKTADGISMQLKKHPALQLHRNERAKSVFAEMKGNSYFFTAQKRKTPAGDWEVVYLISNMNIPAKAQISAYDLRWPMEKMIRTTKQKFGAAQCQALSIEKQRAHIAAGFLAYSILILIKKDKGKKSVDEVVNILREFYYGDPVGKNKKSNAKKQPQRADPIVKSLQNFTTHMRKSMHGSAFS